MVIIFLPAAGLFYYQSMNIPKLEAERDKQNQELTELEVYNEKAAAAVAEIKKQQEYKALIERQIASLSGLSKVRFKYIRVLDLIQQSLPQKMWFRNLKSKDNELEAQGISHSEQEITQFLETISKSIYFTDASMVSSEDMLGTESDNRKFKRFTLKFILESTK
jgi:type IV pilus assembly protein PilN